MAPGDAGGGPAEAKVLDRIQVATHGANGEPISLEALPADVRRKVDHERVRMLYAQAPGAVVMTMAAAAGLLMTSYGQLSAQHIAWAVAMALLMALRFLLYLVYLRSDRPVAPAVDWPFPANDPAYWRRIYCGLVLLTGLHFALWPLAFFVGQNEIHRLSGALVLCALGSGAIAVLSVERWLALGYGALLLIPGSLMLIAAGGLEERICGGLGFVLWLSMLFSVGRTHERFVQSLILSYRNAVLVEERDRHSRALLEANTQLANAQEQMRRTNQRLEQRILERTAELHRLATRDNLTGLANRSRLAELSAAHLRSGDAPVALYFIDLDGFKEINDSMGHAIGDTVLLEVALRLADASGDTLAISRWGGDEFLILRRAEPAHADEYRYAEKLLEALRTPIEIQPYTVRIDACIGIAHWPQDGRRLQELIYSADLAVYSAKAEGRGVIRAFDDALAEQGRRTLQLRQALSRELSDGCPGLKLVYQPIFDAASGALSAVEALLRWRHAQLGAISPAEFIPLAERSGEMIALGLWVMREACRFGAGFDRAQLPSICVNVSVQQLVYPGFSDDLALVLRDTGLDGDRLTIELTESVFIADYAHIAEVFRKLESLRVRIAIDDFGTGYSSLSYLQRLPAKLLKLDGSFVRALDAGGAPIVEAGISLARAFGMKVVAEGVENLEQLDTLLAMGVDSVQGFLLGMPQDGDELTSRFVKGRFPPHPRLARPAGGIDVRSNDMR
jgi:diguanylate cyclase (GGDEF)-like protein